MIQEGLLFTRYSKGSGKFRESPENLKRDLEGSWRGTGSVREWPGKLFLFF